MLRTLTLLAIALPAASQNQNPREAIQRALTVTGMAANIGKVLHWHDQQSAEQDYQSAPPFLTFFWTHESFFDLSAPSVERSSSSITFPGSPATAPAITLKAPGSPGVDRNLNAWAVLADFRDASDLRSLPNTAFMGYSRIVIARKGRQGDERLYLDPKSGFPVKLDLEEPHYLWGQVHVEYLYLNWTAIDNATVCTSSARVVDGFKEVSRTVGKVELIERAAAPDLALPKTEGPAPDPTPVFLQPRPVKRIDVSPNTFITSNTGYNEAFTRAGDTVYVLDATQGEGRAKLDLDMIHEAFGEKHKIAVVVTDTAWPHIAGVRFWVANGATVISHRESRALLTKVIERRWTRSPDLLEQRRKQVKFNFVSIDKPLDLAGGKLKLIPIDGIGSEGALMAWVPTDNFLWAGDYIQSTKKPASYTNEVIDAARRAAIKPQRVAAQHIPLTPWSTIEKLAGN